MKLTFVINNFCTVILLHTFFITLLPYILHYITYYITLLLHFITFIFSV